MHRDQCQHQCLARKLRLALRIQIELCEILGADCKLIKRVRHQDGKSQETQLWLSQALRELLPWLGPHSPARAQFNL